jgi:hypothetical protein
MSMNNIVFYVCQCACIHIKLHYNSMFSRIWSSNQIWIQHQKVGLSAILTFDFRFKSWGYWTVEDPGVNGSPGKDFIYTFLVINVLTGYIIHLLKHLCTTSYEWILRKMLLNSQPCDIVMMPWVLTIACGNYCLPLYYTLFYCLCSDQCFTRVISCPMWMQPRLSLTPS